MLQSYFIQLKIIGQVVMVNENLNQLQASQKGRYF